MNWTVPAIAGSLLMGAPAAAQRIENDKALRLAGEQVNRLRLRKGDSPLQHYPSAAKAAALDGAVVVEVLLNELGQVLEAQVLSEWPAGAGFGLAALDTAKTFEFDNPFRRLVLVSLTIEFQP